MDEIETNRACYLMDNLSSEISQNLNRNRLIYFSAIQQRMIRIRQVRADETKTWIYKLKLENMMMRLAKSDLLVLDTI